MQNFDLVEDHPVFKPGMAATWDGRTGLVEDVWKDDAGALWISLIGRDFDTNTVMPIAEVTPGGIPTPYPPTADEKRNPNTYSFTNLKVADKLVPPGWAVTYNPDGVYVGWGFKTRKDAMSFALGHEYGMSYFGSKM